MAQKIPFMQLSGAGNDFVIIDNRKGVVQYENTDFVQKGLPTSNVCWRGRRAACRKYR